MSVWRAYAKNKADFTATEEEGFSPAPKPAEYDLAGAAAHLGMSQRKLRQMVKDRGIAYRNFFLFTQADLDEYLGAYRTKPKRI